MAIREKDLKLLPAGQYTGDSMTAMILHACMYRGRGHSRENGDSPIQRRSQSALRRFE